MFYQNQKFHGRKIIYKEGVLLKGIWVEFFRKPYKGGGLLIGTQEYCKY